VPRALVTGGAGFLGSHLCRRLLAEGWEAVCMDNFITGRSSNVEDLVGDRLRLVSVDVTDVIHVPGPLDAVLHFASPASPVDYLRYPIQTLKVGAIGTHHALGLAREKGARFLLASTSEVYGDPQVHPQPESYWGHVNPIGPRGVYDEAKRYAEALAMAYHRSHGVPVRIARIFNSILATEQVLYDDGRELHHEPVEALARRLGRWPLPSRFRVPAFDAQGRMRAAKASALIAHPTSSRCYRIQAAYGRSIAVTGDHSLFVEGDDGHPEPRPVDQLRVGERIALAGRLRVPERDRQQVSMLEVWDAAGLDPWKLMIRAPELEQVVWRRRQEILTVIVRNHPRNAHQLRRSLWGEVHNHCRRGQLPLGAMRALGIPIPDGARVRLRTAGPSGELPASIPLTDELLWLLGLHVAEGCRLEGPTRVCITVSSDADALRRVTKIVERDLGLRAVQAKGNLTRGPAVLVRSELLLLLLDHLGFRAGPKRLPGWVLGLPLSRLKWVIEGYREGAGVHSGKKSAAGRRHEFSTVHAALKDDLVVAFARFGLVPSVGRHGTAFRLTLRGVRPWSPLDWDHGVEQRLHARRTGDLVWAQVRAIDEVEPSPLVYDFSVPGLENFWAGGGVMAKNTFGPYMRADDGRAFATFAVQALRGEPLTVHGDGSQTRSLCYVDDLIEGIWRLLESDLSGPVNLGNPGEVTILEMARMVARAAGRPDSAVEYLPRPQDDPERRRPDIARAARELGWKPQVSLDDGIRRTLPWFRQAVKAAG
jgi:UDP-glucuronate decarboxylase